ncbi:hypothetical protein DTO006G1_2044 [Penicillium roqueforti]|uniref:uncharacterized protein n=1 Tax=Penicillium roqueforti TaxID=5082 RepID=UPI00190AE331|nr:uncharacterized protein LCP9604111_323 [Penicillium roqueforti]KAF9252797.1 hypothetical protein LCP9604111_323 [Penicillium roqueforti]KAI1830692.1 hypothetical protein CBS147337_8540 [Penicillium roqueforti]KAI2676099.1 hypothetical protein CBS147355_6280 [Penicillium roqueforti]KAI2679214.1 hypothetical protein LCP963914a_7313 [Penicillium roqueforti]KAI2697937.1 hypothetical protein CBS147372_7509 [Penicillium roqueforti]
MLAGAGYSCDSLLFQSSAFSILILPGVATALTVLVFPQIRRSKQTEVRASEWEGSLRSYYSIRPFELEGPGVHACIGQQMSRLISIRVVNSIKTHFICSTIGHDNYQILR